MDKDVTEMSTNISWKAEYVIVDNARKCIVNFHFGSIEPDQKILT